MIGWLAGWFTFSNNLKCSFYCFSQKDKAALIYPFKYAKIIAIFFFIVKLISFGKRICELFLKTAFTFVFVSLFCNASCLNLFITSVKGSIFSVVILKYNVYWKGSLVNSHRWSVSAFLPLVNEFLFPTVHILVPQWVIFNMF